MPVELSWFLPDKILLSRWSGSILVEDVAVLIEELVIIFDAAEQVVHTIIDLTEAQTIPTDVIYVYLQSSISKHPRHGRAGIVHASFQGEALADLINQVAQRELFRLFDSRSAARDFLLANDTPPPPLV